MSQLKTLTKLESYLLGLLASSANNNPFDKFRDNELTDEEWDDLIKIASWQGIAAIICSQIEKLPHSQLPPRTQTLNLIGLKISQQKRYNKQKDIASAFANALRSEGVKMYILKGFAYSSYYEDPSLRTCGDCDCFLVDFHNNLAFEKGNTIAQLFKANIDYEHYKHSHIQIHGLMIENHEFLTDFKSTRHGRITERLLRDILIKEEGAKLFDTDMMKPNDYFNLLFLVRHAHGDFIDGGLTLRMLYDLTVMLKKVECKINWSDFYQDLSICKLTDFFNLIVGICVKYFGLSLSIAPETCKDTTLIDEVLYDTIRGGLHIKGKESLPQKTLRILKRFKRMWHYRNLATEKYPVMIWNSFAFSSYIHRKVSI